MSVSVLGGGVALRKSYDLAGVGTSPKCAKDTPGHAELELCRHDRGVAVRFRLPSRGLAGEGDINVVEGSTHPMQQIDPSFTALPLREFADAALSRAQELGCTHADLRVEKVRTQNISLRDARLESATDGEDAGLAVRVVHDGTWGFAAGMALTTDEADRLAEQAVAVARVSAAINTDPVELAPEPAYPDAIYVSAYEIDPFAVPDPEKIALLIDWSERLMSADGVEHVQAMVLLAKDQKFYADLSGTS
ncbi:MAG: DNA gyrase modulator, partial [Geodermatophilaceae bacterium]